MVLYVKEWGRGEGRLHAVIFFLPNEQAAATSTMQICSATVAILAILVMLIWFRRQDVTYQPCKSKSLPCSGVVWMLSARGHNAIMAPPPPPPPLQVKGRI